jgi:hypothetical protein
MELLAAEGGGTSYAMPVFTGCVAWKLDDWVVLPMSEGVIVVTRNDMTGGIFESLDHVMKHALDVAQTGWDIDNSERER